MSSPRSGMEASAERFKNITDDAVDRARDLASRTAQQLDTGEYGIDAWSRSMSQFVDIVAKGSAAHFRAALAGPCMGLGGSEIPASEEEIVLTDERGWPRKISIARPFRDVVRPDVVIPNYAVVLAPLVVPANADKFTLKVRLKDTSYIGRNYSARLALTQTSGMANEPEVNYQVVTVAL